MQPELPAGDCRHAPGTAGGHREVTTHPTHHRPVPPASQPWLFTTAIGACERGWRSDLYSAWADLTPPRHLQSLSGKAKVTEKMQGMAGYF